MKKMLAALVSMLIVVLMVSCSKETVSNDAFPLLSADDALLWAKENKIAVCEGMEFTSGDDTWAKFLENVDKNTPCSVGIAHYYTLDEKHVSPELYESEKDSYPHLFFCLLEFDGESFSLTVRRSDLSETDYSGSFRYLNHYTGSLPADSVYSEYSRYVLTDEKDLTWEEIEKGLFSSFSEDRHRHYTVLSDCE